MKDGSSRMRRSGASCFLGAPITSYPDPSAASSLDEQALEDLTSIRAYFEQFNPQVLRARRLVGAADSLAEHAERGRSLADRHELLAVWPYLISYRIHGHTVQIIRLRHGARQQS
jgi:plasmid stabilization system protein ParE